MSKFELFQGDCLVEMGRISGPVDMICVDLPFGVTNCAWDSVIPFEPLWAHFKRLIKPNGAIVLFGSQPFTSALVMSNPGWFKYQWIWNKRFSASFALCNKRPMKIHEDIAVFGSGQVKYFPQMTMRAQSITLGGKNKSETAPLISQRPEHKIYFEKYPESILTYSCRNENGLHPTQKPVALLAYLIRTYTNSGETVLDCCMGSGTTIVAALETGRRGIGIEQSPEYFQIAQRRITDAARAADGLPKQLTGHVADYSGLPMFAEASA